jgi:hypothetical protein
MAAVRIRGWKTVERLEQLGGERLAGKRRFEFLVAAVGAKVGAERLLEFFGVALFFEVVEAAAREKPLVAAFFL